MGDRVRKRVQVRKERWFVPPEAHTIAAQFRTQAGVIRDQATALRKAKSTLDSSWEGNSKNKFMAEFDPMPGNLDSYAAWLEQAANKIERTQAMEYYYVWEYR